MDLIERYVREVGRRLPSAQRDDVQKELHSTLRDALDDRVGDGPADESLVESATLDLLSEFGPPEKLAASYVGPRYLVGPELYEPFVTTLKIVLGVVGGLIVLGWIIGNGLPDSPGELALDLAGLLSALMDSTLGLLGLLVLVFAVEQRFDRRRENVATEPMLDEAKEDRAAESWDPRSLPEAKDEDGIDRGEEIVGLFFVIVALVLVNFAPHRLGAFVSIDGEGAWIPFFGPGLERHRLLFDLVFGGWLITGLWLLRAGRWNLTLRFVDLVVMLGCIGLITSALADPGLVQRDYQWFRDHGISVDTAEELADTVAPIAYIAWRVGLWIVLALSCWSFLTKLWRGWRQFRARPEAKLV